MAKLILIVSATIVVIFSGTPLLASPEKKISEQNQMLSEQPDQVAIDENLVISEAPATPFAIEPKQTGYYSYRQALTIRAGATIGGSDFKSMSSIFGFQYLFPRFLSPKMEAGADVHASGGGHAYFGWRWIFSERSYFRPSVRVSVDHKFDPQSGLATLVDPNDWYARGSCALEYMFDDPISVRLEPEILFGLKGSIFEVTAGLSHGW